jgi:peptidyl-prolyl cis-trans isomerase D
VSLPVEHARMLGYSLRLGPDMVRLLPVTNPDTKAFDYKVYDRVVRQFTNRSPTEFKAMQRSEVLAARMRDLVRARVRVGDDEAFTTYQREKSSATIRFATFRRNWFAHHVLDLSPAAVDAWAKSHQEEVDRVFETRKAQYLPECRSARHVLVKFPEGATDEQKETALQRANAVLDRVRKGEDFAKVAREESDDGSAAEGGDLGCFQRGRMVKPFEDAVFSMTPGQISDVVTTQYGFHVIKLDAIYKGDEAETFGRRETAKSLMVNVEGEALAAETAKKVLAAVKGGAKFDQAIAEAIPARAKGKADKDKGKKGADDASKESGDSDRPRLEISAPFNSSGDPISGVSPGQGVAQIAFRLEKDGDAPDDLVKLNDGYAVMQLKEKSDASRDQFEAERDTFVAAMLAAKQSDALNGYVMRLRDAAKAEIKINEAYGKSPERDKPLEGDEE